jgi:hypothetical protein
VRGGDLRLSSGVIDSKCLAEDTFGAVATGGQCSRNGHPVHGATGSDPSETAGVSNGALARTNNGGEQGEVATGEHPSGFAILRSVTDERHRNGAAFLGEVYRRAQAKEAFLLWWWNGLTQSTRRKR